MNRPNSRTIVVGAVVGGLIGALVGALMASRGDGRKGKRPSATDATAIGITTLGLVKQLIDVFA